MLACGALAPVNAEHDGRVLLRLDGSNCALYDQEYPHRSQNMYSTVWGNPLDSFPLQDLKAFGFHSGFLDSSDSFPAMAASGRVSGELGDPLLGRFVSTGGHNRDHSTRFGTAASIPRVNGFVYSGYRYLDIYTDRFDDMWEMFRTRTGRYMDHFDEGLAHEVVGGYAVTSGALKTRGYVSKYGYWGEAPMIFYPLYKRGYKTWHDLRLTRPGVDMFATLGFDYHRDYYDHLESETFNDLALRAGVRKPLNKRVDGQFAIDINTAHIPSTRFEVSLGDSFSELLTWDARGGLYNDLHPFAGLALCFTPLRFLQIASEAAWDYIPRERSYRYYRIRRPVDYITTSREVLTFHTRVQYRDTLLFPITVAMWYDFCDRPMWETVDHDGDLIIIRQDTVENAARSHVGGRASYSISIRQFFVEPWGNASLTPKTTIQRFSLPYDFGIDIGYGNTQSDRLYAVLRAESRSRAVLQYRDEQSGQMQRLVSPPRIALSALFRMPFLLPFVRDHVGSSFWAEIGPVNVISKFINDPKLDNQRIVDFPGTNPMGPRVAVRFDGVIRRPRSPASSTAEGRRTASGL
jgi:hypothetical protein